MKPFAVLFSVLLLLSLVVFPVAAQSQGDEITFLQTAKELSSPSSEEAREENVRRLVLMVHYVLVCALPSLAGMIFALVKSLRAKQSKGLWLALLLFIGLYFASFSALVIYIF